MRILVLTRSYPAPGDLYQYPFVHRRVLAYARAGHEVVVFRPGKIANIGEHSFEGVRCTTGDTFAFREFAKSTSPDVIAAHGFNQEMHRYLLETNYAVPTCAWLHGSEIPGFFRQKAQAVAESIERRAQLEAVGEICDFWQSFLAVKPAKFKLVFVSHSAFDLARTDMGPRLYKADCAIIPNPIDTDLFSYVERSPDSRFRILLIRPFDSWTYGNDLAVSAILQLAQTSDFGRLQFTMIGDGPMFETTVAPLRHLKNVWLERRFLPQNEIAQLHRQNGIFLVPTRLDTHGVSRDEAMASGLVPVTNRVSAVPEFVDESCAGLAPPDDAAGLAEALHQMIREPKLFASRSIEAARRVRAERGHETIIPAELKLLSQTANA